MPKQIAFSYPRRGLDGLFNTFRLGRTWATKLVPGDEVELVDSRSKKVLKRATVMRVETGPLAEMASVHAHWAHNWKGHPEAERAALLVASMKKRFKHYGPTRCSDTADCSVIYLKEIPCDQCPPTENAAGREPVAPDYQSD